MEHPHTNKRLPKEDREWVLMVMNAINEHYWNPLYDYLKNNNQLENTFPSFLIDHEQIVLYLGKTHIAIEYFGNEQTNKLPNRKSVKVINYDFTESNTNLIDDIIGFKFDGILGNLKFPLPSFSEDIVYPTNKGMDELVKLKWNWMAQNSMIGINSPGFELQKGEFHRIVNARFFDADENGLKTRHIKWLDFLPLEIEDETEATHVIKFSLNHLISRIENDAHYIYPLPPKEDYKYNKFTSNK